MRAAVHDDFGGVDVLDVREVPDPRPGPHDVLISVKASALNRLDILQREGPPLVPNFSLPHIAGMDVAGDVVEVGSAVDSVTVENACSLTQPCAAVGASSVRAATTATVPTPRS